MKVLLVNANRSRLVEAPLPIGLAYVATATRRAGHQVRFLDLLPARRPVDVLRREMSVFCPAVVGFSVRNIDNTTRQNLESQLDGVASLIAAVRASSTAKVVLGGAAITVLGRAVLDHLDADFAVAGEGETALPHLLAALEAGDHGPRIPGVYGRTDTDAGPPPQRLTAFGSSTLEDWIDWRPYRRAGSTWPLQLKRGCPLNCTYCVYSAMEGCTTRAREAREVVDEIERVSACAGPRTFQVVDSVFNVPVEPVMTLCEEILRRGIRVRLAAACVNPLTASSELFSLMKRAGFNSMIISPESASDPVLASLKKGFDASCVYRAAELVRSSGIASTWCFLLGCPGETENTAEETVSFAERRLGWPTCLAIFATGVRLLPGSEIARWLVHERQLDPAVDLVKPLFYLSPAVSEAHLLKRVSRAIAHHPAMVHAAEQGAPLERLMQLVLPALGVTPPTSRFLPPLLRFPPVHALRRRYGLAQIRPTETQPEAV